MRITFEADDLQAIAEAVARKLTPLIIKSVGDDSTPHTTHTEASSDQGAGSCTFNQDRGRGDS